MGFNSAFKGLMIYYVDFVYSCIVMTSVIQDILCIIL